MKAGARNTVGVIHVVFSAEARGFCSYFVAVLGDFLLSVCESAPDCVALRTLFSLV